MGLRRKKKDTSSKKLKDDKKLGKPETPVMTMYFPTDGTAWTFVLLARQNGWNVRRPFPFDSNLGWYVDVMKKGRYALNEEPTNPYKILPNQPYTTGGSSGTQVSWTETV